MAEIIEIRPDGEIISKYLPIGRIEYSVPFTREFEGEWHSGDNGDYDDLVSECNELEVRAEKAENACTDAVFVLENILEDERGVPDWLTAELEKLVGDLE